MHQFLITQKFLLRLIEGGGIASRTFSSLRETVDKLQRVEILKRN